MAILTFSDLLSQMAQTPAEYFVTDSEGASTFSEIAHEALTLSTPSNRLLVSPTRQFVTHFLAAMAAGCCPVLLGAKAENWTVNRENEPSLILLTSGSTGESKAVILTEKQVLLNAWMVIENMDLACPGRMAIFLPLHHSFALVTQLLLALLTGGQIFLAPSSQLPGERAGWLQENRIQTFAGVPTTFKMLLMDNGSVFPHVRHVTIAGAALDPAFVTTLLAAFPNATCWVGYGLTEAGPRVTALSHTDPYFTKGSVGKALPGIQLCIRDGEVLVKSPTHMQGYLNDERGTAEKLADGWLYTGDLGVIDQKGYLYITGRKDHVFRSGGEKISPMAIERVLEQHSHIQAAAVYGQPDDILGCRIIALVQLADGVNNQELYRFCRERLESHLIPHHFEWVNDLPLTDNGKLQRQALPNWPVIGKNI